MTNGHESPRSRNILRHLHGEVIHPGHVAERDPATRRTRIRIEVFVLDAARADRQ